MDKALYRKYRSRKLSEIVGQEHITTTLTNAISNGNISHAYLFTGPRGVGKTSIARILAHQVNDIPYSDESMHLDIIEIDAASNRKIDEIRDLRDKVHITPTHGKYKVYIIDEVHMLTREAFNALLKTLEEPPKHAIFILATTEIHKLPDTIISRTQKFTFKPIDINKAVEHLDYISKQEGLNVDKDALEIIAKHGYGSFRDSISLLDQVKSNGDKTITKEDVQRIIGIAPEEHVDKLIKYSSSGELSKIALQLDSIINDGISPGQIAKQLMSKLREKVVKSQASAENLELLEDLILINNSPDPSASLEVALFKSAIKNSKPAKPVAHKAKQKVEIEKTPEIIAPVGEVIIEATTDVSAETIQHEEPEEDAVDLNSNDTEVSIDSSDWWEEVLNKIKSTNNTLHGVLRMAETNISKDTLNLNFKFSFHKNKISDPTTQLKILEAVELVTGRKYKIKATNNKDVVIPKAKNPDETADSPVVSTAQPKDISAITNIFGGGEVMES